MGNREAIPGSCYSNTTVPPMSVSNVQPQIYISINIKGCLMMCWYFWLTGVEKQNRWIFFLRSQRSCLLKSQCHSSRVLVSPTHILAVLMTVQRELCPPNKTKQRLPCTSGFQSSGSKMSLGSNTRKWCHQGKAEQMSVTQSQLFINATLRSGSMEAVNGFTVYRNVDMSKEGEHV